jgi:small subunit ribosomal protein S6
MPERTPTYDLMLLLSRTAEDEARAAIVSSVESTIADGGGEVRRRDDWGMRPLTFQIDHQREADYHLLQFTGPPSLLETLSHNLHIADGVLRFRIIKVVPGTPDAPESPPPVIVAPEGGRASAEV